MSTRKKGKHTAKKNWLPLILLATGVLLVFAVILFFTIGNKPEDNSTLANTGAPPSLSVNSEEINFGDVKFNKMVNASFVVTNTGGQPLKFTKQPYIELIEGC